LAGGVAGNQITGPLRQRQSDRCFKGWSRIQDVSESGPSILQQRTVGGFRLEIGNRPGHLLTEAEVMVSRITALSPGKNGAL